VDALLETSSITGKVVTAGYFLLLLRFTAVGDDDEDTGDEIILAVVEMDAMSGVGWIAPMCRISKEFSTDIVVLLPMTMHEVSFPRIVCRYV